MKELGAKFKKKREKLDIPLAQARNETKIRMTYLEAIEEGDFEEVEQEVYLKGFLKIYANYLGLDERKIMQEYKEYKKIQEQEDKDPEEIKAEQKQTIGDRIKEFIDYHQNKFLYAFMALLLLLIIIAVLFLGTVMYKSFNSGEVNLLSNVETYVEEKVIEQDEQQEGANSANTEEVVSLESNAKEKNESQVKSKNTSQNQEPKAISESKNKVADKDSKQAANRQTFEKEEVIQNPKQINLRIKAIANSWCAVDINGKTVFKGIMKAGSSKNFSGQNIKLKISNGAGIKIIKNGEELGPFGKAGEVVVKEYSTKSD